MQTQRHVPDGIPTDNNIANAGGDPGANGNHIEDRTADHNAVTNEPERDTVQVGADGNLVVPREVLDVNLNDGAEIDRSMKLSATIIHGDCLSELAKQPADCARLVFADSVYNIGIDYGEGRHADLRPDCEYLAWCRKWIDQCCRVLTDDGSMWTLIGQEYADHYGVMLREAGLHRRDWIIWHETFGVHRGHRLFGKCSRHLFYCVKDPERFVFNDAAVRVPSDRQTKYADKRADPRGRVMGNVWTISRVCGTFKERIKGFPTQLPLALLRPIVGCATDPGDLVIDPFCGSATTGVVALELGRRFIGIEKNAAYAKQAVERLAAVGGPQLPAATGDDVDSLTGCGDHTAA